MSLLAQMNQPNGNLSAAGTPQYYFALDATPANPVVTAAGFEAVGGAAVPNNVGTFTASSDDTTGAGQGVFQIKSLATGNAQWSIGLDGIPGGANSGNNLEIFAYDDNGAFLNAGFGINRATGNVTMAEDVAVGGTLTVGEGTTVGGGIVQANGTLGLSRVFDSVYNPPAPGPEVLLSQYGPTGAAVGPLVPYTPAKTGLYTLTMEVRMDPTGYSWTNGSSIIVGFLAGAAAPFPILSDSFLACDSLANPGVGFNIPSGFVAGAYAKDIVAVINLTAGVSYVPTISIDTVTPFNLGTTGGVRFFIQPVIA